jgi:hypothetical protein
MTMPGVQKPHCEPWCSTMACLNGMEFTASSQVIDRHQFAAMHVTHEHDAGICRFIDDLALRATRPIATVQAPQSPSLQPSLVPL